MTPKNIDLRQADFATGKEIFDYIENNRKISEGRGYEIVDIKLSIPQEAMLKGKIDELPKKDKEKVEKIKRTPADYTQKELNKIAFNKLPIEERVVILNNGIR